MKLFLLLLAAAVAAPVRAADKPLFLTGGLKAEDALRRFVERDPRLKAKLDDAAAREEALLAEGRDSDLRDAVSDKNGSQELTRRLASASAADRPELLSRMPGLKAAAETPCRTLADCATPDLALAVSDAALLPAAVRGLVRPWMLLQQARGFKLEMTALDASGDAVLAVKLRHLDAPALTLNVTPQAMGGFKVWFGQPFLLAALYGRERDAALKSSR